LSADSGRQDDASVTIIEKKGLLAAAEDDEFLLMTTTRRRRAVNGGKMAMSSDYWTLPLQLLQLMRRYHAADRATPTVDATSDGQNGFN